MHHLSPDQVSLLQLGPVHLNATILFTWLVIGLMAILSWLVTRRLSPSTRLSRGQNCLEALLEGMLAQLREVSGDKARTFLPFVGSLFLFIAVSNVLSIIPYYLAPTGSLSTTAALAICVFLAVPIFGIRNQGFRGYLKNYIKPSPIMLPFHVTGEIARTVALAVRLFGNVMSGHMIVAVLLAIAPLLIPAVMHAFDLLTGIIQAYIFGILAIVYITSASHEESEKPGSASPSSHQQKETEVHG